MEKLFVNYSKSKQEFIDSGLEGMYVNKIVFIGNGECIYAKGRFFANELELITLISNLIEQERVARTADVNSKVDKVEGKLLSQENFTTFFKNKLESLNNYDDTELSNKINTLRSDLDTLVGGDTSEAIETFNEIINFLEEIKDIERLADILNSVESKILELRDLVTEELSNYLPLSGGSRFSFNLFTMGMIKELIYLIKLLFSPLTDLVEVVLMKHFPFQGYSAMSWCGKIITRKDNVSNKVINHERIHLEQALELAKYEKTSTWLTYYWQYFKYWIKGNPIMAPASSAYYTIPFEMEAYGNEHNYDYKVSENSWKKYELKNRKKVYKEHRFNWKNYCLSL